MLRSEVVFEWFPDRGVAAADKQNRVLRARPELGMTFEAVDVACIRAGDHCVFLNDGEANELRRRIGYFLGIDELIASDAELPIFISGDADGVIYLTIANTRLSLGREEAIEIYRVIDEL